LLPSVASIVREAAAASVSLVHAIHNAEAVANGGTDGAAGTDDRVAGWVYIATPGLNAERGL
jgi:hypothetical protein